MFEELLHLLPMLCLLACELLRVRIFAANTNTKGSNRSVKIVNGYENIDCNMFSTHFTLVKEQSRLDARKYSCSQRTTNVWN